MPTRELWLNENILAAQWVHPLSTDDLCSSFSKLAGMIDEKPGRVQVLFDLRQAKSIPAHAPMIAIRSGMLTKANTGRVAVVTTDMVAEILAGVAARITHHDIRFFSLCQTALAYLEADTAQPSLR